MVTCSTRSVLWSSQKSHQDGIKLGEKGSKQSRKLSWYVKFRGALAAIRLLAVCVPRARKGLWDPENGSKEDPSCQTPSIQWDITSRKSFQLGKETSGTVGRQEVEGWKGHMNFTAILKGVSEMPVVIFITQRFRKPNQCVSRDWNKQTKEILPHVIHSEASDPTATGSCEVYRYAWVQRRPGKEAVLSKSIKLCN